MIQPSKFRQIVCEFVEMTMVYAILVDHTLRYDLDED